MDMVIETENLVKKYNAVTVVNQVSMKLPRGKIYGLLGRNGAGKTTFMKMLLNLVAPTDGAIKLFGEDYRTSPYDTYSRIGSMIETPGFYENLTANENLQLLQRLRGQKHKAEADEVLRLVGLEKETKKRFADYSLGMKQRLGIAAAMIHKPELLILDEPINGLDPIGIAEIRTFLRSLCLENNTTILISSHVLGEVEQIADVIGVMHEGVLIEEMEYDELQRRNRTYLEVEVSDIDRALGLLNENLQIYDFKLDRRCIRIYERIQDAAEINTCFIKNGITVTRLGVREDTLEEYFLQLIGGTGIA